MFALASTTAVLVAAYVAAAGVIVTLGVGIFTIHKRAEADRAALIQRQNSDDRSEWWARAQWAVDRATSNEAVVGEVGLTVLMELVESPLATDDELAMLRQVAVVISHSVEAK